MGAAYKMFQIAVMIYKSDLRSCNVPNWVYDVANSIPSKYTDWPYTMATW